jgi:D-tyrosyl-tRNA(Tyr) deacylase
MRAVLQRVSEASVTVDNQVVGKIGAGLLVLLGIAPNDSEAQMDRLIQKIIQLRIFPDSTGKMNLSVRDIEAELLVVSQFTLFADCRKGNRPSFTAAAPPELAQQLYELFLNRLRLQFTGKIATGIFGAEMRVSLQNEGPVTIILDTETL